MEEDKKYSPSRTPVLLKNTAVIKRVASLMTPFEAERMRWVSKDWRDIVKPVIFTTKMLCGEWEQRGPLNDHELPFFELGRIKNIIPCNHTGPEVWENAYPQGKIHLKTLRAIEIRAKVSSWQDQGYGYRKGTLFIRLARKCSETEGYRTVESLELFGKAKHHASSLQVRLDRTHNPAFFDAMQDDDSLHLFRYVGNGGGHSLRVCGLEVEVVLARNIF